MLLAGRECFLPAVPQCSSLAMGSNRASQKSSPDFLPPACPLWESRLDLQGQKSSPSSACCQPHRPLLWAGSGLGAPALQPGAGPAQGPRCRGQGQTGQAETAAMRAPWQGERKAQPWHGRRGATHLSVKSSSRSSGRRVREGGVGDGRGQLRGVQWVGSPRFRGGWDESRSSQVI